MKKQQSSAVEALKQASKGLMMPSESDAPFEAFQMESGEPTPDRLRKLAHVPTDAAVEEDNLDNLLATVATEDKSKFQKRR
jgi:hypothetical protein